MSEHPNSFSPYESSQNSIWLIGLFVITAHAGLFAIGTFWQLTPPTPKPRSKVLVQTIQLNPVQMAITTQDQTTPPPSIPENKNEQIAFIEPLKTIPESIPEEKIIVEEVQNNKIIPSTPIEVPAPIEQPAKEEPVEIQKEESILSEIKPLALPPLKTESVPKPKAPTVHPVAKEPQKAKAPPKAKEPAKATAPKKVPEPTKKTQPKKETAKPKPSTEIEQKRKKEKSEAEKKQKQAEAEKKKQREKAEAEKKRKQEQIEAEKKKQEKAEAEKKRLAELEKKRQEELAAAQEIARKKEQALGKAKENLAKNGGIRDKLGTSSPSLSLNATTLPKEIGSLHVDALPVGERGSVGEWGSKEISYSNGLASCLKRSLKLPDYGAVKIKLTLNREGKVLKVEILQSESSKNKAYVENKIPPITFPSFGQQFQGVSQNTFVITLQNDS